MAVCAYHPSCVGAIGRRIVAWTWNQEKTQDSIQKQCEKGRGGMTQMVDCLPSNREALSSNLRTTKNKDALISCQVLFQVLREEQQAKLRQTNWSWWYMLEILALGSRDKRIVSSRLAWAAEWDLVSKINRNIPSWSTHASEGEQTIIHKIKYIMWYVKMDKCYAEKFSQVWARTESSGIVIMSEQRSESLYLDNKAWTKWESKPGDYLGCVLGAGCCRSVVWNSMEARLEEWDELRKWWFCFLSKKTESERWKGRTQGGFLDHERLLALALNSTRRLWT
jgi:hypothetical protein